MNPDTEGVANRLKPHFEVVESYFAQNRPANEVELTRGVWKQLWYKNPDIEDLRGPARLKDDKIYQDVRDGYYMNVSEAKLFGIFNVRGFLRGNYTLTNVANAQNSGEKKLNVIALEFADSRSGFGRLKKNKSIAAQVDEVVSGKAKTFKDKQQGMKVKGSPTNPDKAGPKKDAPKGGAKAPAKKAEKPMSSFERMKKRQYEKEGYGGRSMTSRGAESRVKKERGFKFKDLFKKK
jgi:hypothetical protein